MGAGHRKTTFRIEKFLEAAKDSLLKKYFEDRKVTVPENFEFKRGEKLDDLLSHIPEVRRKSFEEELHLVDDIAEFAKDNLKVVYHHITVVILF